MFLLKLSNSNVLLKQIREERNSVGQDHDPWIVDRRYFGKSDPWIVDRRSIFLFYGSWIGDPFFYFTDRGSAIHFFILWIVDRGSAIHFFILWIVDRGSAIHFFILRIVDRRSIFIFTDWIVSNGSWITILPNSGKKPTKAKNISNDVRDIVVSNL